MKKQSQKNNTAGQSAIEVRKSHKHEVNLQKNSTLYFQIGLILCLLGTFALFEMQFEKIILEPEVAQLDDPTTEYKIDKIKIYKPKVKAEPKKKAPSEKLIDKYIKKDNLDDIKETIVTTVTEPKEPAPTFDPGDDPIEKPDDGDYNIKTVQFVPIFPGCEKYELNSEREKCLNEKMNKLVKRKFNSDVAIEYGLSGTQRIFVTFKVDKTGNITEIKTRSPHPKLDEEALRVANKIPKMTPGKNGTEPVNVVYSLPIKFTVQD